MAGNIDTRVEVIPASGVVNLPNANFLFVISASGATAFNMRRTGLRQGAAQENYSGITAGLQIARVNPWDFCNITGAAGVTVTFMYGNVAVREDVTLFNQQIAVIAGVTAVAINPASVVSDIPAVVTGAGQAALFAANLTRRRITVFSLPTNTDNVAIRKSGGVNDVAIIQPGTFLEFDGTYALDYRTIVTSGQILYLFEET